MAKSKDGLAETMAAFDRLKTLPREQINKALAKSGEELAQAQKVLAPRDTGDLADSIEVTLPGQSTPAYSQPGGSRVAGENEVLVTAGNSDVRYAHLVEFGTSKTEAQPFFWPAFRLLRKRIQRRIDRAGRNAIKEAWSAKK